MQIFKTDKKRFRANELKSWLCTVGIAALVYFTVDFFALLAMDTTIAGVTIMLLLKLGDWLTQFHVKEIQIDRPNNELTFVLDSIMSGEKIKRYELSSATSALAINSGLKRHLFSAFVLKIFLHPKHIFTIGSRYGFSQETLRFIDSAIKSSSHSAEMVA